jgi:hypothetical protein
MMEVGGCATNEEEINKLMNMKFPLKKDGTPDGRRSEFRRLLCLGNGASFPVNTDGSPDMRFTKNPEILKMKLKALTEKNF